MAWWAGWMRFNLTHTQPKCKRVKWGAATPSSFSLHLRLLPLTFPSPPLPLQAPGSETATATKRGAATAIVKGAATAAAPEKWLTEAFGRRAHVLRRRNTGRREGRQSQQEDRALTSSRSEIFDPTRKNLFKKTGNQKGKNSTNWNFMRSVKKYKSNTSL